MVMHLFFIIERIYSQINKKSKLATEKRSQTIDDFDSIVPGRVLGNHLIDSVNMSNIFKYPFCRQTIFCVAKWKVRMSKLCEPVNDDIVRICTDSITLKNQNEESLKTG